MCLIYELAVSRGLDFYHPCNSPCMLILLVYCHCLLYNNILLIDPYIYGESEYVAITRVTCA